MNYDRKSKIEDLKAPRPQPDNKSSMSIGGQEPNSTAVGGQEPNSTTVGGQEPNSTTVGGQEPNSITVPGEEPNSTTVGGQEPSSTTVGGQEPNSTTVGGQEPSSTTVGGQEPNSTTIGGQEPNSITIGDDRQYVDIPAFTTENMGHNAENVTDRFYFEEASDVDINDTQGAVSIGYKHSQGLSDGGTISTTALSLFNAFETGLNTGAALLHCINITYYQQLETSLAGVEDKEFPYTLEVVFDAGEDVAFDIATLEAVKIYFPQSTILAPMRIAYGSDGDSDESVKVIGPFSIPFVVRADSGVTVTFNRGKANNTGPWIGKDGNAIAGSLVNGTAAVYLDGMPVEIGSSDNIDIQPIYAVYGNYNGSSTHDPVMENRRSYDFCDRQHYESGWEYVRSSAGIWYPFKNDPTTGESTNTIKITLEVQPIAGPSEAYRTANSVYGSRGIKNGVGYARVKVLDVEDGSVVGGPTWVSATTPLVSKVGSPSYPKTIMYGSPNYSPILNDAGTFRSAINQERIQWVSSGSYAGKKYRLYSIRTGAKLCLAAAAITSASTKSWFCFEMKDKRNNTVYYHPENLHIIWDSLIGWDQSSGDVSDIDIEEIKILDITGEKICVKIECTHNSTDYTFILTVRKATAISGGSLLVSEWERETWLCTMHIYDETSLLSFDPRNGHNGGAALEYNINEQHRADVAGWDTIQEMALDTKRNPMVTIFGGNGLFLDKVSRSSSNILFSFGQPDMVFVPFVLDDVVIGFNDTINYGLQAICIPCLLPTVSTRISDIETSRAGENDSIDIETWVSRFYGFHSTKPTYLSGMYDLETEAVMLYKSTAILYTTPAISEGNVYSSLPSNLSSLVGTDLISSGCVIGKDAVVVGNNIYSSLDDVIYPATSKYQLNADKSKAPLQLRGKSYSAGNNLMVSDTNSLTLFSSNQSGGLDYITSFPISVASNIVFFAGMAFFASATAIYAMNKGSLVKIRELDYTYTNIVFSIVDEGQLFVLCVRSIDSQGYVIYADGSISEISAATYSPSLHDRKIVTIVNNMVPDLRAYHVSSGSWGAYSISLARQTASTDSHIESNLVRVSRAGQRFVLTKVYIHFYAGTGAPFDIYVYDDGSSTALWSDTSPSYSASVEQQVYLDIGNEPVDALRYKITNIDSDAVIYDVKFIGYYTQKPGG